ncbi:chitobiase/beta-hexosaminidase C-terminal domain-containing protein [Exiguobacterium sp. s133]|uniref:chitobiase/beta-hexosaminidase C-terminal domain-containing protein n=1 Tax=Exiguobacterium sp. s133 TaxID=2751213 RepID=UPI001BE6F2B3|nr:chitobiase/beta-hexosaminidase C-terminal domain-containing protein [Exiguobacterium sp. s133]
MKYGSTFGKWALVGALTAGILPQAGIIVGAEGEGVILSEYIEGSSNNKAIEIYNGSGQIINLADYTLVQYTNGGPSESKITLSGTIDPGKTFVIANSSANADIKAKAQQTTGSLNFNGNDPVALKKGDVVLDIIGPIGSSADFAKDTTLVRNTNVTTGSKTYEPSQWTSFPVDTLTDLGSHKAEAGDILVAPTADPVGEVERGDKVTLTGEGTIHYTVDGLTPTVESPVYSEPITINEEMTIQAVVVKNGKTSAVSTFKYYIAPPLTKISSIQGIAHLSPYADQLVRTTGVVTYIVDANNFYMQDPNPDNNSKTSEGILVYSKNHGAAVGQKVATTGYVKEWLLGGYSDKAETDLPVTELSAVNLVKGALNEGLPASIVLGGDGVLIPTDVVDNDAFANFDPEEDAIDLYESVEGMRVALPNAIVTGPQANRTIPVRTQTADKVYTKRGTPILTADNVNPERLFVEMGSSSYRAKSGDRFEGTIEGVMSYNYSAYKVLSKAADLPKLVTSEIDRQPTNIETGESRLTVASYNVENFASTADAGKVDRVSEGIATFLKTPDIVGLTEMQDNDGAVDSGTVDASKSFETLIAAIEAKTGVKYAYTDIAPEDKKDGGQPGGNIRVGFLYNPERVSLAPGKKGTATEAVSVENGKLTSNPGRIQPLDPNFASSRKPLVGEFLFKGESYHVIVNHFNSKGGDGADFGKNQPVVRKSEVQRHAIATIVQDFVNELETEVKDSNVVVLGDLNDFQFSKTLDILKGKNLWNTVDDLPKSERYSYVYNGNAQVLDHILISKNLKRYTSSDIVNINSDYMEADGSASDHDPAIISIQGAESAIPVKGKAEIGKWRAVQKGKHIVIERKIAKRWLKVSETHGQQQGELLELRVSKGLPYILVKTKKDGQNWLELSKRYKLTTSDKFQ